MVTSELPKEEEEGSPAAAADGRNGAKAIAARALPTGGGAAKGRCERESRLEGLGGLPEYMKYNYYCSTFGCIYPKRYAE